VAKEGRGKEGRWRTEKEERERDLEKGKTRAGMPAIKEV